jgi:membrane protein
LVSKTTRLSKIRGVLSAKFSEEHPFRRLWGAAFNFAQKLWDKARQIYHKIDNLSGSRLSLIRRMARRFAKNRGAESAASLSYYTIFSIFPMLVFITSATSLFLDSDVVKLNVLVWLTSMLPVVPEVILDEIENLIDVRTTTVNLVALASFLWSASGAFNALALSLNRVWNPAKPRHALINRLFGLGMVASLVVLVMMLLLGSSMVTVILGRELEFVSRIPLHLIPILIRTFVFYFIYRLVPGSKVNGMSALLGAFVASSAWEINTVGFTWVIKGGFTNYEFLYGSLGTIIALLFWVFLSYYILLMGAYFAEADGYRKKVKLTGDMT